MLSARSRPASTPPRTPMNMSALPVRVQGVRPHELQFTLGACRVKLEEDLREGTISIEIDEGGPRRFPSLTLTRQSIVTAGDLARTVLHHLTSRPPGTRRMSLSFGDLTRVDMSLRSKGRDQTEAAHMATAKRYLTAFLGHLDRVMAHNAADAYGLPTQLYRANVAWRVPNRSQPKQSHMPVGGPGPLPFSAPPRSGLAPPRRPNRRASNNSGDDEETLGVGGFGVVTKATITTRHLAKFNALAHKLPATSRLRLGQTVAIKEQHMRGSSELKDAIRETQAQIALEDTGLVPVVYASGWSGGALNGKGARPAYLIAMDLVRGKTLEAVMDERGGVLSAALFAKVEDAVFTLWMRGFAHADLNPRNIMVTPEGEVKLIDFLFTTRLPPALVPRNRTQARSRAYQASLLRHLNGIHKGMSRYAPDPHVLAWAHAHVPMNTRRPANKKI